MVYLVHFVTSFPPEALFEIYFIKIPLQEILTQEKACRNLTKKNYLIKHLSNSERLTVTTGLGREAFPRRDGGRVFAALESQEEDEPWFLRG